MGSVVAKHFCWSGHWLLRCAAEASQSEHDKGLDLQKYMRIRIFLTYYFTTTGVPESKFIPTVYFVKEFAVEVKQIGRFITFTIIKITLASSSRKNR